MFIYRKRPKKTDRKRTSRLKAKLAQKNKRRVARNAGLKK
jgi:hypothetical protein